MKIGVVGTFIRDKIISLKKDEIHSIGGIFFTVSYLSMLLDPSDEIYPACFVGEDFYDEIISRLLQFKNVHIDGIVKSDEKNTQVTLTYTAPQERDEVISKPMPHLHFDQLKVLSDADAVIINLITGSDVDLVALQKFRESTDSLIYLEFHSHALGINDEGKRFYQRPDDWQDWVQLVDVLQLNEMEAWTLYGNSQCKDEELLIKFGKEILSMNPSVCHITLADKGSLLFYKKDRILNDRKIDSITVNTVVNIIGCGDAFASAYLTHFLKSDDIMEATLFANKVAAINCTVEKSLNIKQIRDQLRTDLCLI